MHGTKGVQENMDDFLMMMTTKDVVVKGHGKDTKFLAAGQRVLAVRDDKDDFMVHIGNSRKKAAELRQGELRVMPGFAKL